jgi:hypothetical protein
VKTKQLIVVLSADDCCAWHVIVTIVFVLLLLLKQYRLIEQLAVVSQWKTSHGTIRWNIGCLKKRSGRVTTLVLTIGRIMKANWLGHWPLWFGVWLSWRQRPLVAA